MNSTHKKKARSPTPELSARIIASVIDGVITLLLLFSLFSLFDLIAPDIPSVKPALLVIGLSYEPLLCVFRCTVGQWFVGNRVRNYETGKMPTLFEAYLRYFYKLVFGWKALLFYSTEYDRLIHDNFAGTVVVRKHSG